MKIALTAILAICLLSCSGSKKAIENKTEQNNEITESTKKTEVVEKNISDANDEIQETIEVVNEQGKVMGQTDSHDTVDELLHQKDQDTQHQIDSNSSQNNHRLWNELLAKYVSFKGNVDYNGFKQDSKNLSSYISTLQADYSSIEEYSKAQKLAYWINAYNALTIDLILRNYPLNSIKDIKDPWDQRLWKFGEKWLNLNDIEHKILRKMDEPRIHFAIICASESCPKLLNKAYSANNLEEQLSIATKDFLSDASKNELSENSIKLSKIFKWFAKDFKTKGSLIKFLNQYSEVTINENAKKSYKDYSWELND
jgi:hypothetical protein